MDGLKKVPWADWGEWLVVWELLRSSPREALVKIEAWSHVDVLPVRVECTRVLLKCLNDLTKTGNPAEIMKTENEITRLAVSMAVVRCTNLIIDVYNDCKFARSVAQTAKSINLPEFIVDIRHDATHSTLPSGFILSKAVKALLDWLLENYWDKQRETLKTKSEKILNEIEKFEQRAKTVNENYTLVKYSESLFNDKIIHKDRTGKTLAELRWKMKDEAWALLFLALQSKNHWFGACVTQGALSLLKDQKISVTQAKETIQEILALSNPLKISYTVYVKHLMALQNEDEEAFDLVKILLEHQALPESVQESLKQLNLVSMFAESCQGSCEIQQLPVKRWRNLKSWSVRPIGSFSVFNE